MSTRLGRPTVAVVLSDDERETLERWARRPTSAQALALRCRIVLAAAEGTPNTEIAAALGCHPVTAGKWRRRFAQRPVAIAVGERPGAELPVGGQEPAGVAFAEVHQLSRLPDRDLLGEDAVEYVEPCLFVLVQCHFLHGRTESLTS